MECGNYLGCIRVKNREIIYGVDVINTVVIEGLLIKEVEIGNG